MTIERKHMFFKYFLFLCLFFVNNQIFSQDYKITTDEKNGEPLILGYCPVTAMNDSVFNGAWSEEYKNYKPYSIVIDSLKGELDSVTIKIVFRSTCSDSREQLPRFFKILEELNYPKEKLTLIGVSREKKGLSNEAEGLDIEFVPTFIFYKDGKEIGRIVETPAESLEKDLLKIISQ
jgi:thiol-disulfide isomerase/thioredoxin